MSNMFLLFTWHIVPKWIFLFTCLKPRTTRGQTLVSNTLLHADLMMLQVLTTPFHLQRYIFCSLDAQLSWCHCFSCYDATAYHAGSAVWRHCNIYCFFLLQLEAPSPVALEAPAPVGSSRSSWKLQLQLEAPAPVGSSSSSWKLQLQLEAPAPAPVGSSSSSWKLQLQ
jgi:hypothetical protein